MDMIIVLCIRIGQSEYFQIMIFLSILLLRSMMILLAIIINIYRRLLLYKEICECVIILRICFMEMLGKCLIY